MPDELKPIFTAIKTQLVPSDELVAKTLKATRPKPRRIWRWAGLAAAFVAGVGITALVTSSLSSANFGAKVWPSPNIAAEGQEPVPGATGTQTANPALYAGLFKTLTDTNAALQGGGTYTVSDGGVAQGKAPAPSNGPATDQMSYTVSSSGTNVQVAGIDEGDIVKTDGSNIYVANGRQVKVITADGADSHQIATIDTSGLVGAGEMATGPVVDMMIDGTTLVLLVHVFTVPTDNWTRNSGSWIGAEASGLKAAFYDITDAGRPQLLSVVTQSGAYTNSRLADGTLYLVSQYYVPMEQADPDQPTTFVPTVDVGDGKVPLAPADVQVMPWVSQTVYSVITAIDVATRQVTSDLAVLGDSSTCYMSQNNLYLASQQWAGIVPLEKQQPIDIPGYGKYNQSSTNIMRISLGGGQLKLAAAGRVAGFLINQFALDELDGNLRVVTTWDDADKNNWVPQSALWVLDSSLNVIGSLPKLMTNETVQSVRFDAAVAYIVTFRQRDPLFTVDLTDPKNPKVQGALKIPGFSAYLHPFGDGLLLGIGYDAKDDGTITGLKLTMFGVTDPYNVTELATTTLKGGDTEVAQDHHACFVDVERGLIGFPTMTYDGQEVNGMWVQSVTWNYQVYSWNGTEFRLVKTVSLFDGTYSYTDNALQDPFARGLLLGDSFYVVTNGQVTAYDLNSFRQQAKVVLG